MGKTKAAQQCVHCTLGTAARRDGVRDLQAFFWLRVFSAPKQSQRPTPAPVTQTVERQHTTTIGGFTNGKTNRALR